MNNTHFRIRKISSILFLVALFFSACSPAPEIVGIWKIIDGSETWEFKPDGSLILTEDLSVIAGTYEFIDDEHIEVQFTEFEDLIEPLVFEIAIEGNLLTLYTDLYGELEYQRISEE